MITFETELPSWFILFCLLAGALYAFLLYKKDKATDDFPVWARRILPVLRFLFVSLLAYFLLGPMIKTIFRTEEKPILLIAQDNSASIVLGKDSSFYKTAYTESLQPFIEELKDKFEVQTYTFGSDLNEDFKIDFSRKETNMSAVFDEIESRLLNRNVGAMILAGDGLYNSGKNPVYYADKLTYPVYTIALGDTAVKRDLFIEDLRANRIAFLGNDFPVEISVAANRLKGRSSVLKISKNGQEVFKKELNIDREDYRQTIPVMLPASATGLQRYRVTVSKVEGEDLLQNNTKDFFIDVLDSRQKILIVSSAPHPDVNALVQVLDKNKNYEVQSILSDNMPGSLGAYSLVILHQIPDSKTGTGSFLFKELADRKIPVLYIAGTKTNPNQLNRIQKALQVEAGPDKISDAKAAVNANFNLFGLSNEALAFVGQLPPLQSRFGRYSAGPESQVLLYQKIGFVTTEQPMIVFGSSNETKAAVIAGEGIFRWRLTDYVQNDNHEIFEEIIGKIVQYLVVKADKSFFRVSTPGNFFENQAILFEAEVYNESYESINDPDVSLVVYGEDDKQYPFTFSRTQTAYRLDAGRFPPGNYQYKAKVKVGEKIHQQNGEFSVAALDAEWAGVPADHQLLYALANRSGGELFTPADLDRLRDALLARDDVKPVSRSEKKLMDLINLKWIFILIVSLVSVEWFLRKFYGAY